MRFIISSVDSTTRNVDVNAEIPANADNLFILKAAGNMLYMGEYAESNA
jgi:hypothetical protein